MAEPTVENIDNAKMEAFFGDLEVDSARISDLELLVEAERRGLLDDVAEHLLEEARERGLIAPSNSVAQMDTEYFGSRAFDLGEVVSPATISAHLSDLIFNADEPIESWISISGPDLALFRGKREPVYAIGSAPTPAEETSTRNPLLLRSSVPLLQAYCLYERMLVLVIRGEKFAVTRLYAFQFNNKQRAKAACKRIAQAHRSMAVIGGKEDIMRFTRESQKPVSVRLSRTEAGYGFSFVGPNLPEDPPGIFLAKITPGGAAHRQPALHVGLQIVNINGHDVETMRVTAVKELLKKANFSLTMELIENPAGYAHYLAAMEGAGPRSLPMHLSDHDGNYLKITNELEPGPDEHEPDLNSHEMNYLNVAEPPLSPEESYLSVGHHHIN